MREKVTVEYISSISSDGVPYVVVLKSLNAKSTEHILNDLHDHAVQCDDGKMIELVAEVMSHVKELEKKCKNYQIKLEHIRHDLDEK